MSIRLRSLGIRVIPKKPDYDCSRAHFEHFLLRHPERLSDVIPNVSEESTAWMLHFAYAPFSMTRWCHSERSFLSFQVLFFCHSERMRGIPCDVDASLRSA